MDQLPRYCDELIEIMRNEFMAIVERAGDKHTAYCPELPEAKGQGRTKMAALIALADEVSRILDARRESAVRTASDDAIFDTITVA